MFARLLLLLIVAPLVDFLLLVRVGLRLGPLVTLAVIVGTGMLGVWVARNQGLPALLRVVQTVREGKMPREDVLEGLLILVAGVALVTPGFLADALGFFLLIPFCRTWARRNLSTFLSQRFGLTGAPKEARRYGGPGEEVIIDAEVIRSEPKRRGIE